MQVPQLIYGSSGNGHVRGYQILGRSPGVGELAARSFSRWAPSHRGLRSHSIEATGWSWFQASAHTWVIARTVYGNPEYSGRGGRQVITIGLLLNQEQLAGYENHPLDVARTALSLGHLILPATIRKSLPNVTLPRTPFHPTRLDRDSDPATIGPMAEQIRGGHRVQVSCEGDPIDQLSRLFCLLSAELRLTASFTTGLQSSNHRPAQIQFCSEPAARTR